MDRAVRREGHQRGHVRLRRVRFRKKAKHGPCRELWNQTLCVCAQSRNVSAHCPDYGCATLMQFFAFAPVLKEKLEAIREGLGEQPGISG